MQEQSGQHILDLPNANTLNGLSPRRTFDTVVVAAVVIVAVAIPLAILLVVLLFVADQIIQSEAIMTGHEIDTAVRSPTGMFVEI